MLLVWLTLALLLLVLLGGAIFVFLRLRETARSWRRLSHSVNDELAKIAESSERTNQELEIAAKALERLNASLERLSITRAQARVLTDAYHDVEEAIARARVFLPSKGLSR